VRHLLSLDERLVHWLNGAVRRQAAVRTLVVIGASSFASVEVGLLGLVALSGRPMAAVRMVAAVGLIYGLVEVAGRTLQRARPWVHSETVESLVAHDASRSFPSRHVASAFAMATVAAPERPGLARVMGVIAWLLGLTRVGAGLHYPSDALAGAALGVGIGRLLRHR
jgi:undecaprenyl-diphosphatase